MAPRHTVHPEHNNKRALSARLLRYNPFNSHFIFMEHL